MSALKTSAQTRKVWINQQHVLNIQQQDGAIELNNLQVPYQMVISPISEGLTSTEGKTLGCGKALNKGDEHGR